MNQFLIFFILFIYSFSVFGDTYPASPSWQVTDTVFSGSFYSESSISAQDVCTKQQSHDYSFTLYTAVNNYQCNVTNKDTGVGYGYVSISYILDCQYGGILSGTNCINAPSCDTGQTRNSITGECQLNCPAPEVRNTFGDCYVQECLSYEVLNPTSGACQTPPNCGASETYDASANLCFLKKLGCPLHSHASTANDQCLADPPLACPSGQHDDGTYTCVADDAQSCRKDQTTGYINGQLACINPPYLDTAQKAAADAAKTAATTANDTANITSQTLKDAANALTQAANNLKQAEFEYSADPTNTTKEQAVRDAITARNTAQTALTNAEGEANKNAQQAQGSNAQAAAEAAKLSNDTLASIDYTLKQTTAGTGNSILPNLASTFDSALADSAIEEAKTEFQTQWASHKSSLLSMFSFSNTATSNLPTFDYGTIKGVPVVVDLNQYATPLSYIGLIVMFLAAFLSVRIFLE